MNSVSLQSLTYKLEASFVEVGQRKNEELIEFWKNQIAFIERYLQDNGAQQPLLHSQWLQYKKEKVSMVICCGSSLNLPQSMVIVVAIIILGTGRKEQRQFRTICWK